MLGAKWFELTSVGLAHGAMYWIDSLDNWMCYTMRSKHHARKL